MRLFAPLYDMTIKWASHRHAVRYLVGLSVAEATVFPIPPDVMLAPMVLAQRERGWFFAFICTAASVLGGMLGYLIGANAFDLLQPLIVSWGYQQAFDHAKEYFEVWGFWFILVAGFSPIPYKIFTIASGAVGMPFVPFLVGSVAGRSSRFFLVAGLIVWGGEAMASGLRKHVETVGWLVVAVLLCALVVAKFWLP